MSIVIFATFVALTLAQLVFWETLGETFGYAASVSVMGLCASITLLLAAYVAATHTQGNAAKNGWRGPRKPKPMNGGGMVAPPLPRADGGNNGFAGHRPATGG